MFRLRGIGHLALVSHPRDFAHFQLGRSAIVTLRRAAVGMACNVLSCLEVAAVLEKRRYASRPETVACEQLGKLRAVKPALHHFVSPVPVDGLAGE